MEHKDKIIKVVNAKYFGRQDKAVPTGYYIYCGRPSPYGNPYYMANEAMRQKVIADFEKKILPNLDITKLIELSKKGDLFLGCFCAPKACHCDKIKEKIENNKH